MKKIIILLTVLLVIIMSGCTADAPDVSLDEIAEEIRETINIEGVIKLTNSDLLSVYGIFDADIEEQASFTAMNGIFPDEVIVIKATDDSALERIKAKLDTRLSEVMNQSKSYDAEGYAIAQKCAVNIHGLYIALFVSRAHEQMTEIYNSHF